MHQAGFDWRRGAFLVIGVRQAERSPTPSAWVVPSA